MLEENLRSREASEEEIRAQRREKGFPIMDAMEAWMESVQYQCTPDDPLGRALEYAYKLWPRARRYADDGRYHIDNNPVECRHILAPRELRDSKGESARMAGICARQPQTGQYGRRTDKITALQLQIKHARFRMGTNCQVRARTRHGHL